MNPFQLEFNQLTEFLIVGSAVRADSFPSIPFIAYPDVDPPVADRGRDPMPGRAGEPPC